MTTAEIRSIIAGLHTKPPFSQLKVEWDDRGWAWIYCWTGAETIVCFGPTLPWALQVMSGVLYKRFGAEV